MKTSKAAKSIASIDRSDNLHVYPLKDWSPHSLTVYCTCHPQVETINGVKMIIHHAFDRRELWERERPEREQ